MYECACIVLPSCLNVSNKNIFFFLQYSSLGIVVESQLLCRVATGEVYRGQVRGPKKDIETYAVRITPKNRLEDGNECVFGGSVACYE